MTKENVKMKILEDPNYIALKRFDYSLSKLIDRYPNGVPNKVIGQALQLSEEEVEKLYQELLTKLREKLT